MCDICCGKNCSKLCKCMTIGIDTPLATEISEGILTGLGCTLIELGFEFGWHENNNIIIQAWIKESILSSGISATYAVLISTCLKMMNFKWGKTPEHPRGDELFFYTKTLISQILSGVLGFGMGMLFDFAFHRTLDDLEKKPEVGLSLVLPAVLVSAKILSRIGIFKAVDIIRKCCSEQGDNNLLDSKKNEQTYLVINL